MKRNSKKYGLFWMFVLIFCLIFSMSIPAQEARHVGQRIRRVTTAKNDGGVVQKTRNGTSDARTGASTPISLPIAPAMKYDILAAPEYTKLVRPSNQEPEFTYSFTYPIPPSYAVRYYDLQYVSRYSRPHSYQFPPLFVVQDTAAYNRMKSAEIEAREAREAHEQQQIQENLTDLEAISGTGITIYGDSPSQESSREEQSAQLIVVEKKPPTILKMKTKDVEAEAFGLSAEQFQQLLSTIEAQKAQETAFWKDIIRLLFELLGVITGTILLGYTIKWAMQKA